MTDDNADTPRRLIDPVLAGEADEASYTRTNIPITLQIAGVTWTGEVIAAAEFFDAQADYFAGLDVANRSGQDLRDSQVENYRELAEAARTDGKKQVKTGGADTIRYVHLGNARRSDEWNIYPAMRFKLAAVEGWTLGTATEDN